VAKAFKIKGTIHKVDINGGFWGITDSKDRDWLPVELDEDFKIDNLKIVANIKKIDVMNNTMWGQTVEVVNMAKSNT